VHMLPRGLCCSRNTAALFFDRAAWCSVLIDQECCYLLFLCVCIPVFPLLFQRMFTQAVGAALHWLSRAKTSILFMIVATHFPNTNITAAQLPCRR
jgi:hypothetical protein